jgi:excisionase family DNA binding protein
MPSVDHYDLLTADELAYRLGVKPGTIREWHRAGRIPCRRLSRKVLRFDLAAVLAALESSRDTRPVTDGPGGAR